MKLADFIKKYKIVGTEFASTCGITYGALGHYIYGRRKPTQSIAEKIEKESDGLVTVRELRGKDARTDPGKLRKRELPIANGRCPLCQSKTTGSALSGEKRKIESGNS
jgi:hypothetical protein